MVSGVHVNRGTLPFNGLDAGWNLAAMMPADSRIAASLVSPRPKVSDGARNDFRSEACPLRPNIHRLALSPACLSDTPVIVSKIINPCIVATIHLLKLILPLKSLAAAAPMSVGPFIGPMGLRKRYQYKWAISMC